MTKAKTRTKKISVEPTATTPALTCTDTSFVEVSVHVEQNTDIDMMSFPEDYRKTNPGLHMLYTKWAIPHLVEIDKAINIFYSFSNMNMLGAEGALFNERNKLIKENAAYAEADEILKSIHKHTKAQ